MSEANRLPQIGIMQVLRDATADRHRRAEAHPFQRAFVKGRISRALYGTWLSQMRAVHDSLEAALDILVGARQDLDEVCANERKKVRLIEDDLAHLNDSGAARLPLPATRALVADIERRAAAGPIALLGVLYVLEGSTNGSRFIALKLRQSYRWQDGRGCGYLDPYGDRQGEMWAGFKAAMDRLRLAPSEVHSVVAAACDTFDAVYALSDELAALVAEDEH